MGNSSTAKAAGVHEMRLRKAHFRLGRGGHRKEHEHELADACDEGRRRRHTLLALITHDSTQPSSPPTADTCA